MQTEVIRIPTHELSITDGPRLVVVPAGSGEVIEERYECHEDYDVLPADTPLVAIFRTEHLSSPDEVAVTDSGWHQQTFNLTIEVRQYQGDLFANVVTTGFVSADLGSLDAGEYAVAVTETLLYFDDISAPEDAANPTTTTHDLEFVVR